MSDAKRKSRKALALLETLGAEPTPMAYSVAYRMVDEPLGQLARAVERHILAGIPLDEERLAQLSAQHVETPRVRAIGTASAELGMQMVQVRALMSEATRASDKFGKSVTKAEVNLGAANDKTTLGTIINGLLQMTRGMEETQAELTQALREKEAEIASINSRCEAALSEARLDPLTTLANRKRFDEEIFREVHRSDKGSAPLSLLVLDIDHFKTINDQHGHPVGDLVIRQVADIIRASVRDLDLPARIGGEEFAVILPRTGEEAAAMIAEAIRINVESAVFERHGNVLPINGVTISVGLACHNLGETPDTLVERADVCLYGAKRSGRNRLVRETNSREASLMSA